MDQSLACTAINQSVLPTEKTFCQHSPRKRNIIASYGILSHPHHPKERKNVERSHWFSWNGNRWETKFYNCSLAFLVGYWLDDDHRSLE